MEGISLFKESPENRNKKSPEAFFQPKLSVNQPNDVYEQEADAMADKVMRITDLSTNQNTFFKPDNSVVQRKCQACEEEDKFVHRKESSTIEVQGNGMDNYIRSLSSGGEPMSASSRNFFEPRFGHDFSGVKIHTDTVAAKSARAINALAYTTGNNIVFNSGQYSPESDSGKKLMAHELTHVIQQSQGLSTIQRISCPDGATAPATAAAGAQNSIDTRAQNIITRAADATLPVQTRATRAISDIICAYYPGEAGKVRNILYDSALIGLKTTSVGSGTSTLGDITVGDYFVNNISATMIARRILQTGHELDHIGQFRIGLTGPAHKDEREFLAFYHNALADEFEGTGRMPDNMRKAIIDQSLGYYYCLDATLQQQHQSKQQELLTRRQTVNGTSGNAPTTAPTACARQH